MDVKVIRMWSGEDVIAEIVEEKQDSIIIRNPIVAVPTSEGQMGFAPWAPLLRDKNFNLEVVQKYIVYIAETQDAVVEQYQQMFSPIQTPTKKLIL